KPYAMVAPFPSDESNATGFAACPVVSEGNLKRGLHSLRTGICKEDAVEPWRCDCCQSCRELERPRLAHLKGRRIIQRYQLVVNGIRNLRSAVPEIDAPHSGGAVENKRTILCHVMHALSGGKQAGSLFELPVPGKGHPVICQWKFVHRGFS